MAMQNQFYTFNLFAGMGFYARDSIMGTLNTAHSLKDTEGKEWSDSDFVELYKKCTTTADM